MIGNQGGGLSRRVPEEEIRGGGRAQRHGCCEVSVRRVLPYDVLEIVGRFGARGASGGAAS